MKKICSKCKDEKDLNQFNNESANKDGLSRWCRCCHNEYVKAYKEKNKEYTYNYNKEYGKKYYLKNSNIIIDRVREYSLKNKDRIKIRSCEYRKNHKIEKSISGKKYRVNNKDRLNLNQTKYMNKRRREDSSFHILCLLRLRLWHTIKGGFKSKRTLELVGCSLDFLKNHLQQTAIKNGYTNFDINNYSGKYYHIDHIIPCKSFNLKCSFHQKMCFNYNNMQILTRTENLTKYTNVSDFIEKESIY